MAYQFNAFSKPLAGSSPTQLRFRSLDQNPTQVVQVRINGAGLSINSKTGVLSGAVTSIDLYDATDNVVGQSLKTGLNAATTISTFAQQSLAVMADTFGAWNLVNLGYDHFDTPSFLPGGTSVTAAMKTAAGKTIGYLKITGTGLTDQGFDNGHITSFTHLDAAGHAVAGHIKTYATAISTMPFQYGLLSVGNGNDGNSEVLYKVLTAGNDTLTAKMGNPGALDGGAGNDTYELGSFNVYIDDVSGNDTITSTVSRDLRSSAQLGAQGVLQIENVQLLGATNINAVGNALNNKLTGNDGNNLLDGGLGSDALSGGKGIDTLVGGRGRDFMTGGLGKDTFDFNSVLETGKTAVTRDVIKDFEHTIDKIDLKGMDANSNVAADQAFMLLAAKGAAFTGVAGQLHYFTSGTNTVLEGDTNGDKVADFQIELTGLKTLTAGDFVL